MTVLSAVGPGKEGLTSTLGVFTVRQRVALGSSFIG